jgi:membrane-associated phospholipid phosphatase
MPNTKKQSDLFRSWKIFLIRKNNKRELLFTLIILAAVLFCFTRFLNYVEMRAGYTYNDPLLNLFAPVDLTWIIFGLIYAGLITAIYFFIRDPHLILTALQAYLVLVILRTIAMYLLPLNPPTDMISLNDPFVQIFGSGEILTKDLFFSGHTATLFLLFLMANKKTLKIIFLSFAVIVGISVLLQHVHYSIDVFTAPFFSYASVKLAAYIKKRSLLKY